MKAGKHKKKEDPQLHEKRLKNALKRAKEES